MKAFYIHKSSINFRGNCSFQRLLNYLKKPLQGQDSFLRSHTRPYLKLLWSMTQTAWLSMTAIVTREASKSIGSVMFLNQLSSPWPHSDLSIDYSPFIPTCSPSLLVFLVKMIIVLLGIVQAHALSWVNKIYCSRDTWSKQRWHI